MNLNPELLEIGERLRTQDNRITQHPMFCVQELRRDYGYSTDYTDDFVWVKDCDLVSPETRGAQRVGYKDRWETVMVAFTEIGCQEYIKCNGHNHRGGLRIYAESFNRCPEMIAIREYLMSLESVSSVVK